MAEVSNPHKKFQFSVFIFGINPFLFQKLTIADIEIEQVEHGEGNHKVKTAGMKILGNVRLEKLFSINKAEKALWTWFNSIQNEFTGGGALPDVYKREIQIQMVGNNGSSVVQSWSYSGAWPCKVNGVELDRLSSDNTIQSIELSVDKELVV